MRLREGFKQGPTSSILLTNDASRGECYLLEMQGGEERGISLRDEGSNEGAPASGRHLIRSKNKWRDCRRSMQEAGDTIRPLMDLVMRYGSCGVKRRIILKLVYANK